MAQCGTCVARLYKSVIEEVIAGVREHFLDEGIDEQVLMELKQQWEAKLAATKAAEHSEITQQHQIQQQQQYQSAGSQSGSASQTQTTSTITVPSMTLVPVQITVPSQQAGGVAKTITIHVPSTALSTGVAGEQLQIILSSPAAAQTFALESTKAAEIIQRQLNTALQQRGIALPPQLLQYNHPLSQVDGPADAFTAGEFTGRVCEASDWIPLGHRKTSLSKTVNDSAEGFRILVPQGVMDKILVEKLKNSQVDGACGLGDSSDEISDDEDDDDEDDDKDEEKKDKEEEEEEEEESGWNDDPLNSDDDVSDDDSADQFETENVVVCQYDKITRVRNKWKFHLKDGIMNLKKKDYVFMKSTGEGEW